MFENILIGVDGCRGGRDAIALAKQLAAPGARFTLAHVVTGGPVSWWRHHLADERVFDREASMLDAERRTAAIPAEIVCVGGVAPGRGLHALAWERAADVIVIGCSKRALLGRVRLGGDARASLDAPPCPVAIAPHGYADTHPPVLDIDVGYDTYPDACAVSTDGDDQLARMR
jgi:nucleotide-binding universal stress UspA family protein